MTGHGEKLTRKHDQAIAAKRGRRFLKLHTHTRARAYAQFVRALRARMIARA